MSNRRERLDETRESVGSVLEQFEDWYHVPVLSALVGFMLWVRLQSYDRFVRDGDVFFSGNDAWYHYRMAIYTVEHWPSVMPFDPWTYYPFGTNSGQFGTLVDQLVATAALVVGLGDPSTETIGLVLLVAPAVFGALVALPTYGIGKRLGGRFGGLFGVLVLALLPGTFLRRSLVGFSDHHVAEVLFQAIAVLAVLVALSVAEREKPVYELLQDGDYAALRAPVTWSALAGVATALYIWAWPPGVLLVGIVGVFFALKLTADYVEGVSPDHLALVGAVSMGVTGVLTLLPLSEAAFSPTGYTLLQPLLAFAVAGGCLFLAWLGREWDRRAYDPQLFPGAVGGLVLAATALVFVALPDLFGTISTNVSRIVAFGTTEQAATIGEAQPFMSRVDSRFGIEATDVIFREYGATFFTALGAVGYLLAKPLVLTRDTQRQLAAIAGFGIVGLAWVLEIPYGGIVIAATLTVLALLGDHSAERLFVLVWAAFITAAAFTQVRFNYYLVVPVAVLNAYLMGEVLDLVDLTGSAERIASEVEFYQVLSVALVFVLLVPVLAVPVQIGSSGQQSVDTNTAVTVGNSTGPGDVTRWDGSLNWMQENTPEQGTYGGANGQMEYYGTYERPPDDDFDYSEGTYGVMSWWDYGHWITVGGERTPNANPFQQGATSAANYLLAPNESRANEVVDGLGDDHEQTRYVMVDWQMASIYSKFSAPTVFYDDANVSSGDFYRPVYALDDQNRLRFAFYAKDQRYYDSQMARLYHFHGSAAEPQPIVIDWEERQSPPDENGERTTYRVRPQGPNETTLRSFGSMAEAREYVEEDGTSQVGGVGPYPSERVEALEHYRLVKYSDASATESGDYWRGIGAQARGIGLSPQIAPQALNRHSPAWVKTFERVPGATVEGTGPADSTVTAQVELEIPAANETFTYTQHAETDANGEFTMTLPYASTGYDEWGTEEGYTNVSVRATGEYAFSASQQDGDAVVQYAGSADVTEGQVVGEDEEPVTVELERNGTSGGDGENSSGDGSDGGDGGSGDDSGNESSSMVAPTVGVAGVVATLGRR